MSTQSNRRFSYRSIFFMFLVVFVLGMAAGAAGWIWITGGSGEASISIEDALATSDANDVALAAAVGTAVVDAMNIVVTHVADMSATLVAEMVEPVEFSIVSSESLATFTLEEDLRGARTTVLGSTSEVAGKIMVDMINPAASSIGTIVINARTLETDQSFRNRALRSSILKSAQDAFEFIVFQPKQLSSFSAESLAVGESITFDITGDLTVADVTNSVTFNAKVTLESETQISGSATVNVLYRDFGLTIPSAPGVANVTDDVDLSLQFVARADG